MQYLLVGGSNCVIRQGYGEALRAAIPGIWRNQSLGNSPSARGVDYLLAHPEQVCQADRIVFEYCLNDLIFERANTLDPISHAQTLRAMIADAEIAARLVFVLLCGRGPIDRVAAGHSFVVDHYRRIAADHDIPLIDLTSLILTRSTEYGPPAVFQGQDHFTDATIKVLVEATGVSLATIGPRPASAPPLVLAAPRLERVHPLHATRLHGVEEEGFRNSLINCRLAKLSAGATIDVMSPGGLLLGWYALCTRDAGMLQLTSRSRNIVKTMRHSFAYDKPFIAFRHLTSPLPTQIDEVITLRVIEGLDSASGAQLDPTLAQVVNGTGGKLAIGELLFLRSPESTPYAVPPD